MTYDERTFKQHSHRYFVDSETRDEVCLCGAIKGEKKRGNKFNAIKTEYKNQVFDSRFEANRAAELDLMIRSGQVKNYLRQVLYHLYAHGAWICDYKLDFLVEWHNGTIEAIETKGRWTPDARLKWKLFVAQMNKEKPHIKCTVEREVRKPYKKRLCAGIRQKVCQ